MDKTWGKKTPQPLCECGCGLPVRSNGRKWHRFIHNHHSRIQARGERSHKWKGGIITTTHGYVLIHRPDHHRADALGYVRRSLLVAEEKLGRPILSGEVIHHLNRVRNDDRPENLQVFASQNEHLALHNRQREAGKNAKPFLRDEQVIKIKSLLKQGLSHREIARINGIKYGVVGAINRGKTYKWVTHEEPHTHDRNA